MRAEERRVALGLAIAVAILLAFLPALIRTFLSDHAYWNQIYIWVLFFAMCATAWNIIGGYAGQYSFGHAAFLGIGAYISLKKPPGADEPVPAGGPLPTLGNGDGGAGGSGLVG